MEKSFKVKDIEVSIVSSIDKNKSFADCKYKGKTFIRQDPLTPIKLYKKNIKKYLKKNYKSVIRTFNGIMTDYENKSKAED